MSLSSMPIELLHHVCCFIGKFDLGGYGVKDFRSLTLSCRFLYKFVRPYLYKHVRVNGRSTFSLLRSMIENPELVSAIEHVTLSSTCHKEELDLGKSYTLLRKPGLLPETCVRYLHPKDHEAISLLLTEALILQLSHAVELSININDFPPNAVFFDKNRWKPSSEPYLSRLLPALKELEMSSHPLRDKKLMIAQEKLRESQEDEPLSGEERPSEEERLLQEIERLSEDGQDLEQHRDMFARMRHLIELSKTPNLFFETDYPLEYSCFDLTLPRLEKLEIWCEGMDEVDFESLLESCPNMRSLTYSGGEGPPMTDDFEDYDAVTVRTIVRALQDHQHVLGSLEIGFFQEEDGYIMRSDAIPDLSQFSQLTNLKLDWNALFEVPQDLVCLSTQDAKVKFIDKLPRTLEKLRIFQAYKKHVDEIRSLARRKAQDLPKFKTLVLEWWCGDTKEPLKDLEDELSKAGIEFLLN